MYKNKINTTGKTSEPKTSSAPAAPAPGAAAGGLTRLGYEFPCHVASRAFFEEFIAGFQRSGAVRFTALQCSMLDELVHNRAFQVTSPDVSCGSGKTSLTVAATIGLFQENDKIIFVNKPGRGESSLTKELKQLVENFSGGPSKMSVHNVLSEADAAAFVSESDVIITNCLVLGSVLKTVVEEYSSHQLAATPRKVYIIFDEAHKIFNHDGLSKMASWTIERERQLEDSQGKITSQHSESTGQPLLSHVSAALILLHEACTRLRGCFVTIPIFLSAVGDFSTSKLPQKKEGANERVFFSSEVVEMCISQWMKTSVTKLVNRGNNSERNYNTIYKIHREGAIQIGGVDPYGYAMVYEAMFKIAFKRLIKGRMLFIVRRQQVDTFSALLDAKIKESGSFYSYTADRDYWNAIDEDTLRPAYNIVIVREDELDDLEGVNIEGLRAVYLFSLGRTKNLYQKMQGLGRVGRLGQEASYCFVMIDCATKKNGAIEAESSPFLMEAMNSNGTCCPHIIEVKGAKALDVASNIPAYSPQLQPPTPLQLQQIQKMIKKANRPQVCKLMQYSPAKGTYECPSLKKGYRCAWHHPQPSDFVRQSSSRFLSLKCCTFNTSYCKKGVFREAPCHCVRSLVPITPLTATTVAWTLDNPTPCSVTSSLHFPELGYGSQPTATATSTDPEAIVSKRNPRLDRPVCRFAAMDMYKCKTRREGKLCFFRHPEEALDCVTDEEYLDALKLSLANLNKTKAKYGQKPIEFSKDLYSKYNFPGRFKSNLVKPFAAVKLVSAPAPVQSLASVVFAEEAAETASNCSLQQPLFAALQVAYKSSQIKKTEPSAATAVPYDPPPVVSVGEITTASSTERVSSFCGHDNGGFTDVSRKRKQVTSQKKATTIEKLNKANNYFELLSTEERLEEEEEEEDDDDDKLLGYIAPQTPTASMKEILESQKEQEEHERAELEKEAQQKLQREAAAEAAAVAVSVVQFGLRGADLVDHLHALDQPKSRNIYGTCTTAAALASAVFAGQTASTLSYQWLADEQLGLGMKHLLRAQTAAPARVAAQVQLLEAVELFCHALGFVKVEVKSGDKKYLIGVYFRLLYAFELVDEEGFFAWHEQDSRECIWNQDSEVGWRKHGGGEEVSREEVKLQAVLQTTEFFSWLLQEQEQEEEGALSGYGEERDYASSREMKEEQPSEQEDQQLSKADRKALKQLRRQEKVAGRGGGNIESKLSHVNRHPSSLVSQ